MKKLLLATSILAGTAGLAAAEVTLSGDARMGIIDNFGDAADVAFTSRARVSFTLSGSTDSGLEFGASFRADNAGGAASGTAGSVYVSGAFGKLSMGDVDGAGAAAVGQVDGVGLTGLGDLNELSYLSSGGTDTDGLGAVDTFDPSALFEYSAGAATIYASVTNPDDTTTTSDNVIAYGLGVKYAAGAYTLSAAAEMTTGAEGAGDERSQKHFALGADATFGQITMKARYGTYSGTSGGATVDGDQWAVSATYSMDALSATVFIADKEDPSCSRNPSCGGSKAYGIGMGYDLGGGASVKGGYVKNDTTDESAFDLGLSFSF